MASEEYHVPGLASSGTKLKRTRKSCMIPLESGQRCIAAAMSKVINNMVDKQLQQCCKDLLNIENVNDTEARINYMLQQIDSERENKEKAKKSRGNKKMKEDD